MNRLDTHASFVDRFSEKLPLIPFSAEDADRIGAALQVVLPVSYLTFIKKYGAIRCDGMLDLIVDQEPGLWDIASFLPPSEMAETTLGYVDAGMREGLICFASDCMGNMFCFQKEEIQKPVDDATVWLFDHDFCKDRHIAPSFDAWLDSYLTKIK